MSSGNYPHRGRNSLQFLEKVDRHKLTAVLGSENIRTIAVILNNCNHLLATKILAGLPDVIQKQVVSAMKSSKDIPGEIIDEMAAAVKVKLTLPLKNGDRQQPPAPHPTEEKVSYGGPEIAASILKHSTPETRKLLLENDPALFAKLNSLLFIFDDFINSDNKTLQTVFTQTPADSIALALKVSTPALREKIISNLSPRKAEVVEAEITASNRISIKDIEEAQKSIIDYAFSLQSKGIIVLDPESDVI
ncbi:MAG: FliG C-terminal domain-containing protein [Planctomycetota bacterium]|jgi:flagellar motor switch protein FliG